MKKFLVVLLVLALIVPLVRVEPLQASNPSDNLAIVKERLQSYLKEKLNAKEGASSQQESMEVIDGVTLPAEFVKAAGIKSGEDVIAVYVVGDKKPLLSGETTLPIIRQEHQTIISKINQSNAYVKDLKELSVAVNAVTFRTKIKDINKLRKTVGEDKLKISNIYKVELNYSVPLINADDVWSGFGADGTGMYVGVVDTGVDYTHPDLGGGWGNKVVAGYDFGDKDSNPMDCQGHGTHVAGIMAADGVVKGVAPKAKIVVAKIVQGCEGSATGIDIAAAFDYMADPTNLDNGPEGTHPPVTAINMSFGSPYGFVDPWDIEHWAIESCTTKGIFVSLSAGNEYWAYAETFGTGYKYSWLPDMASVGAPSITPSAMSVAASYNSYGRYPALTKIAPSPSANYAYTVGSASPDPITKLGDNSGAGYSYVNCGYGGNGIYDTNGDGVLDTELHDFPVGGIAGKIALIRRGMSINFLTKVQNAYAAGAIGVIIYNNASGYINMSTDGQPNIPAVFISQADGEALLQYAEANANSSYKPTSGDGTGRVGFRANTYADVAQATDTMVDFSSWGPAPDLSFKPEITAPGGGIWSTVPVAQGSYANYSGTSMAAPHVAAAAALVKQVHPSWSVFEIKTALMNAAKLIVDPSSSVYYSPHLVGAGRVDVEAASKTPVLVTNVNPAGEIPMPTDEPYVALGEQPDYKTAPITFTLKLKNYSSTPVTYNAAGTVQTVDYALRSRKMPGATITITPSTVTVPANSTTSVVVTVDARNCIQSLANLSGYLIDYYVNYIEGFVRFVPTDPAIPEVHIPYMGILGKWNQFADENAWDFNPIIDPPADDPYNLIWWWYGYDYIDTWPMYLDGGYLYSVGTTYNGNLDRNAIAINPDEYPLVASFGLLRNAQNVTIEIRDASNNLVKTIDSIEWMYKDPYTALDSWYWYYFDPWEGSLLSWDGLNEVGATVPDGKYKLVINATPQRIFNKADPDAPQIVEFPVSVDRVPPNTSWSTINNSDGTVTVNWTASDPAPSSGIWGFYVEWASGYKFVAPTATSYTIPAGQDTSYVEVYAIDNAQNMGFGLPPKVSITPNTLSVSAGSTAQFNVSASDPSGLSLTYSASATPKPAGVFGLSSDKTKLYFTPQKADVGKTFKFTVTVTNALGAVGLASCSANVYEFDLTPPTLTLPTINGIDLNTPTGLLQVNTPTLTFTVSATDESGIGRLVVKVNGVTQIDKNNLDPTITLQEGMNTVEVTVYDTYGNYTTKSFKVLKDTEGPTIILPSDLPQTVYSNTFTLKGTVVDTASGVSTLTINNKPVIPTLNGNFELQLTLTQGTNTITIEAVDKLNNKTTKTLTLSYTTPQTKTYIITLKVGDPHITINGTEKNIDAQGSKPIIKNSRTLLPIRVLIESLGGTVEWDNTQRKVTITLGYNTIELWIGKPTAKVNGVNTPIDSTNSKVVPEIINGRTYLPLRFISENLGASVDWDAKTQTITIYYFK